MPTFYLQFENCIWIALCLVIHVFIASFPLIETPCLLVSLALMDLLALSGLYGFKVLQTHICHSHFNMNVITACIL